MINAVIYEGNVVEDAEPRAINRPDGTVGHVVNCRVACSRPLTQEQRQAIQQARQNGQQANVNAEADFMPVVIWRNLKLEKGTRIIVQGRIKTGSYTNQQGVKVYTTEIEADDISFPSPKTNNNQQTGNPAIMPPVNNGVANAGMPIPPQGQYQTPAAPQAPAGAPQPYNPTGMPPVNNGVANAGMPIPPQGQYQAPAAPQVPIPSATPQFQQPAADYSGAAIGGTMNGGFGTGLPFN